MFCYSVGMSDRIKADSCKVYRLPTGYEPPEYLAAQRQRRIERHERVVRRQRVVKGIGVVAATAGIALGVKALSKDPVSAQVQAEAKTLSEHQATKEPVQIDNATYTFRPGVHYRSTPNMINPTNDSPDTSNISGTVEQGKLLVAKDPLHIINDSGEWVGFRLANINEGKVKDSGSTEKLAKDLKWINIGQLDNENPTTPYYDVATDPETTGSSAMTAYVSANGGIHLLNSNRPAAFGQIVNEMQADDFFRSGATQK